MARKDFYSFVDEKIYDRVSTRKDKLLRRLSAGEKPPLLQVSEQKYTEMEWLEKIGVRCSTTVDITDFVEYSAEPPYVVLRTPKGKTVFCGAVCVEYFRLHELAEGGTAFRRYTYFEVYYDDKVIACLMELPFFERRGNMEPLGMNEQDWMNSKRQMRELWKIFLPEMDEIEEILPRNFLRRIKDYKDNWEGNVSVCTYPDVKSSKLVWPLATYLISLQLMPALPKKMMPWYLLNYVCKNDDMAEDVAKKLHIWTQDFLRKDPIVRGEVNYGPALSKREEISNSCEVRPYIQVDKPRIQQKAVEQMQEIIERKRSWEKFPFGKLVPILVSTEEIVSSAVINIIVDDPQHLPTKANILLDGFQYGIENWGEDFPEDFSEQFDWMHDWKDELRKAVREAQKELESEKSERQRLRGCQKLFQLATNFLVFYGHGENLKELSDDGKSWASQQRQLWSDEEKRTERVIEELLKDIRKCCQEAEEIKKGETEIPDGGRRKIVNDHELLVFGYAKFKKMVQGKWPWLSYSALTKQLCDMGVMTCREGMDYSTIKVGEKSVNVAAFYTEELKKQA